MDTESPGRLADRPPASVRSTSAAVARSVGRTVAIVLRHAIVMPRDHVGDVLRFADGTQGVVYRETRTGGAELNDPALLLVCFRLRWVRGVGHRAFRIESLFNTPLFVGFPGFRSKLWLTNDENQLYRGVYQWDGAEPADFYARRLWRILALVSSRSTIRYVVLPGLRRDDVLKNPALLARSADDQSPWWLIIDALPHTMIN